MDEGYENIVIIAVGQSNIGSFNSNFTTNSDLPLVMDIYPDFQIRDEFNGAHKQIVILDAEQNEIGRITLGAGLNLSAKNYIREVIMENYPEEALLGDINGDQVLNIQDLILLINMIINQNPNDLADLKALESLGLEGVIIGKALYEGRFSLRKALDKGSR